MHFKRFYPPFLFCFLLIMCSFSLCFAQSTTNTTLSYPYYQTNPYAPYQATSYWPNTAGSYLDPYSQYTTSALNYAPLGTNPYNPFGTAAYPSLNPGNSLYPYNYNPYGYGYSSSLYGSLGTYGLPLNLASLYYPGLFPTNYATNGTTDNSGTSDATNGNYITQANTYYPTIYPGIQPNLTINPYALSTNPLNPFTSYIPNQSYYQNPYASYPYNYGTGQVNPVNPYQQYTFPYTNPYSNYPAYPYNPQPSPYYQTPNQSNILDVTGSWSGTWFTTLANGTVNNGDASLSLTQNGTEAYGTVTFSLNSYQKLNTNINGTITGASLALTGSLMNGAETYTLTINGNVSGNNLSGTYSITTNSASVIESGTYSVVHL